MPSFCTLSNQAAVMSAQRLGSPNLQAQKKYARVFSISMVGATSSSGGGSLPYAIILLQLKRATVRACFESHTTIFSIGKKDLAQASFSRAWIEPLNSTPWPLYENRNIGFSKALMRFSKFIKESKSCQSLGLCRRTVSGSSLLYVSSKDSPSRGTCLSRLQRNSLSVKFFV